jgi:predicted nucleic acid-binding protein
VTVVVDASVVVAALSSGGATGRWAESVLAGDPLAAPHVLPVEAASILHRAERAGEISADAASLAYADLGRLRVEYFPYAPFAERIWELCAALPGSHRQQAKAELLQRVRLGIADAQTSRKRVELQMNQLRQESTKHEDQAGKALRSGREDLALEALQRKSSLQTQLNDLQTQYAALQDQEEKLTIASQTLQARIDAARLAKTEATRPGNAPQAGPANLSCYDAWYVALAEFLGVKLATLNARLARTPGPRCGFWLPPAESAPGP